MLRLGAGLARWVAQAALECSAVTEVFALHERPIRSLARTRAGDGSWQGGCARPPALLSFVVMGIS
jgi:hypothetical protein